MKEQDFITLTQNVNRAKGLKEPVAEPVKKKSKYHNEKVEWDGEKFDSKKELARYKDLLLLEKQGEISEVQKQVTYRLEVNGMLICKYIADFTYKQDGVLVIEDTKSLVTKKLRVYLIKKALMKAIYNIDIKES